MDTNVLASLVQALVANKSANSGPNSILIVGMLISALAPTLAAFAAYISNKDIKTTTAKTAVEVEKIHTTVNSERTILVEKLDKSQEIILEMVKRIASLEEYQRKNGNITKIESAIKSPP